MKETKNIPEAKALIKKYRSITIEQIREAHKKSEAKQFRGYHVANTLTGFGCTYACNLCVRINTECEFCIYVCGYGCFSGKNKKAYDAIYFAETEHELLAAFGARADHIENILITNNWN